MDARLLPLAGVNNVSPDAALRLESALFVRDALNVDIDQSGQAKIKAGARKVSDAGYSSLWQSPLHGDTFGVLGDDWVRIDPLTWECEVLASVGGPVTHCILNSWVCAAAPSGLHVFDGVSARALTINTPASPLVIVGDGSLTAGKYGVAVAWLRGEQESATSSIAFANVGDGGSLEVTLPLCLDPSVTKARLYMTRANGGELLLAGDFELTQASIRFPLLPDLGRGAAFLNLSPMPTGDFLSYWRGRLLVARGKVLRWSEALAYHLHDERYGFVQMPQRITFVQPVDGGIWVGQVDHVVFLSGTEPGGLVLMRKQSRGPIAGSATLLSKDDAGELSPDGAAVAVWLADNGYVVGSSSGALFERSAGVMTGIKARHGTTVVLDRRLTTALI